MADRTYLIKDSEVTAAMEAYATADTTDRVLEVASADVAAFEALLPADQDLWVSSDTSKVNSTSGFQTRGILLPKKAGG